MGNKLPHRVLTSSQGSVFSERGASGFGWGEWSGVGAGGSGWGLGGVGDCHGGWAPVGVSTLPVRSTCGYHLLCDHLEPFFHSRRSICRTMAMAPSSGRLCVARYCHTRSGMGIVFFSLSPNEQLILNGGACSRKGREFQRKVWGKHRNTNCASCTSQRTCSEIHMPTCSQIFPILHIDLFQMTLHFNV